MGEIAHDKEAETLAEELCAVFHEGDRSDEDGNWLRVAAYVLNRETVRKAVEWATERNRAYQCGVDYDHK